MNKYDEFRQIITQRNILSNFQENKFLNKTSLCVFWRTFLAKFSVSHATKKLPELSGSFFLGDDAFIF